MSLRVFAILCVGCDRKNQTLTEFGPADPYHESVTVGRWIKFAHRASDYTIELQADFVRSPQGASFFDSRSSAIEMWRLSAVHGVTIDVVEFMQV